MIKKLEFHEYYESNFKKVTDIIQIQKNQMELLLKVNEIIEFLNKNEFASALNKWDETYNQLRKRTPFIHETYWLINSRGQIHGKHWKGSIKDCERADFGNCFQSEKSATEAREKIKQALNK